MNLSGGILQLGEHLEGMGQGGHGQMRWAVQPGQGQPLCCVVPLT